MTNEQKVFKATIYADLNIVRNYADSNNKYEKLQAAYHMQQAIEKTIKLKASTFGINLWGHNITFLLNSCKSFGVDIGTPKLIIKNAAIYTSWEAKCRYEPTTVVNKNSIWAAYRVTVDWLNSGSTAK